MTNEAQRIEELEKIVSTMSKKLREVEERFDEHAIQIGGAEHAGGFYPHPYQRISVAEFAEGRMRIDKVGVQIQSEGNDVPGLAWTNEYVDNFEQDLREGVRSFASVIGSSNGAAATLDIFVASSDQANSYTGIDFVADQTGSSMDIHASTVGGVAQILLQADQTSGGLSDRLISFLDSRIRVDFQLRPVDILADEDDWNPWTVGSGATIWTWLLLPDAPHTISGILPPWDLAQGNLLWLINNGPDVVTLLDDSSASSSNARFQLGADVALGAGESIFFLRGADNSGFLQWRPLAYYHIPSASSGGGGMSLIVKSADESVTNSTTLQDDDELFFPVGANEKWQFEGVLLVSSDSSADFKLTFIGPTGAVGSFGVEAGNAGGTSTKFASGGTLGSSVTVSTVSGTGTPTTVIRYWGGISNGGTAGSLKLQWAQNTAFLNVSNVRAGSYIKFQHQV